MTLQCQKHLIKKGYLKLKNNVSRSIKSQIKFVKNRLKALLRLSFKEKTGHVLPFLKSLKFAGIESNSIFTRDKLIANILRF